MKKIFAFSFFLFAFITFIWGGNKNMAFYFQQEVNYKINVKLDDVKHELNADVNIEYINNSPNALTFLWFHLWPNGYKNNYTPLAKQLFEDVFAKGNTKYYFAANEHRGWIDQLDFKVNGRVVKIEYGTSIDMCKIILNEPINPGGKITITTPFNVHIPLGIFSRLGHIGQQYQITQWYPKPAVYDKYGWHPMPYLNQGEFYSEFGNFEVNITLPKNYVVGATGIVINGDEENSWLMKNAEETKTIEKFNRIDTAFPPSSSQTKILHYQATDVHDFAWFADKRYHVLHDTVILPHSKKKVDTWVMFTSLEGEYWKKSIKYVNDAIYYYSLWNGDYPYPHATAVDGALSAGGGMEYPMITVIGKTGDDRSLEDVIVHEVGHNWFYGILGSNERNHAWMDEGTNSFYDRRYTKTKYPPDSAKMTATAKIAGININIGKLLGINPDQTTFFDLIYRYNAVQKKDQPIDFPSGEYTMINYGTIVYGKAAVILEYLQAYLGTELFDKCAKKYFEQWKFKHPYPDDIKKVYEEVSGKDLSWFFDNMIRTTKQIDYKISSAKNYDNHWEIKIKNKGKIISPFSISAIKDGKIISTQWYEGFVGKKNVIFDSPLSFGEGAGGEAIKIDAENKMPDINRQNNTLKMKGLFKNVEPLNLKMLGLIHNPDKTQLFWVPAIGWNYYNKFMLGAVAYNNLLPEKKLEWQLMPMYGFGNKDLSGGASVFYNIHPNKIFQTIRFGINTERYCYENDIVKNFNDNKPVNFNFNKLTPQFYLEIKKKRLRSSVKQYVLTRHVNITKEIFTQVSPIGFPTVTYRYDSSFVAVNDITYKITDTRPIHPYDISFNVQQGERFMKSSVTVNHSITFKPFGKGKKQKQKGMTLRFFAGKFLYYTNFSNGNYFFYSSGTTGIHDYLYDNVFLGRFETKGFLSHQFAETESNMKVPTMLGRTRDWIVAFNIDCSLPGKIPFRLYFDFSAFSKDILSTVGVNKQYTLYDFGLHIPVVKNIIDIYIPVFMSSDIIKTFYAGNSDLINFNNLNSSDPFPLKRTLRMIRFTFNIHKINPFEMVRNLSL